VPMWMVVAVIPAASDLRFRAVEGAASLADWVCIVVVGSSGGREEVEGSCSWVAILKMGELTTGFRSQRCCFVCFYFRGKVVSSGVVETRSNVFPTDVQLSPDIPLFLHHLQGKPMGDSHFIINRFGPSLLRSSTQVVRSIIIIATLAVCCRADFVQS